MSRFWNRLCGISLRGPWRPGSYSIVQLLAQSIVIWTAAQRGMDYLNLPPFAVAEPAGTAALSGIEADVPLWVLGMAFLVPAGVAFVGLSLGWHRLLSTGHLICGASYLVLAVTFLRDAAADSWLLATGGVSLLIVSALLLVIDFTRIPDILAVPAGILSMIAGGWIAARGLGFGYRTGYGFLGAALLHFVFGFGTQITARRAFRLRHEEEADLSELGIG
jgi:hypothetical protein